MMKMIMLSCKNATELLEKKGNYKITSVEVVKLFFHTSMCNICKAYESQTKIINNTLFRLFKEQNDKKVEPTIPKNLKEGIIKRIEEEV